MADATDPGGAVPATEIVARRPTGGVVPPNRDDNGGGGAFFNGNGFILPTEFAEANIRRPPPRPGHQAGHRGDTEAFVMDDGVVRSLHFNPRFVQSEMSIDQPYALKLAYTRQMMAFLLFVPRPRHIVIVGLGGGSLTKFCYRELPRARVTTVEIDQGVIDCGRFFDLPDEDERMHIVHADAVDYFAADGERADVILLDGCDEFGIVPAFGTARFYQNLRQHLRPGGILVCNLIGADEVVEKHRRLIADSFADRVIVQDVVSEGNRVAFAFNDPWRTPDWPAIEREARKLARRHGLDFPAFVRRLQRGHEQQVRWRGR